MKLPFRLTPFLERIRPKIQAEFGVVALPEFQGVYRQGMAIFGGALVGLLFWTLFQSTPVIPPYSVRVDLPHAGTPPSAQAILSEDPHAAQTTQPEGGQAIPTTTTTPDIHPIGVAGAFPVSGMTEDKKPYGPLPIIRPADQARPFNVYKRPFPAEKLGHPLVAFIVRDVGLSAALSAKAFKDLPADVSVLISANAGAQAQEWANRAHKDGHEIWAELSVEPPDYPHSDTGTHSLLTSAAIEDNQKHLMYQMGAFQGYAGFMTPEESPYFISGADADFLSGEIFSRGLGLVIGQKDINQALSREAAARKTPLYAGDMMSLGSEQALDQAEGIPQKIAARAQAEGFVIVVVDMSPAAIDFLPHVLKALPDLGVALAPLSVIAERGGSLPK